MTISSPWRSAPANSCVAALLLLASTASAQSPTRRAITARLDSVVSAFSRAGDFSGVVLVADHGRVVYRTARGLADREWNVPISPDAVFRIGSTTKQFTAMLVLTLVEDGHLRLDGHISDYLADYPRAQGERITIRQLLSHTSGIPEYVSRDSFFTKYAPAPNTPTDLMARFSLLPLDFEPGAQWDYSNSNYVVLGAIIERVTGKPYADVLQDRIAGPLHLASLAVDDGAVIPHRAVGYFHFGPSYQQEAHVDPSSAFGAGFLRITAADLLRWEQSLYHGGVLRDSALAAQMFTPVIETGTPLGGYGFGYFIGKQKLGGKEVLVEQHGGTISAFVTGLWRMPDDHRTVIVLSNLRSPRTTELVAAVADAFYRTMPAGSARVAALH